MKRKILAFVLCLIMIVGLSACSSDGKKPQEKQPGPSKDSVNGEQDVSSGTDKMGRYMESEVMFPELEADESIISMFRNSDDRLEIYTQLNKKYFSYCSMEDGSWEEQEAEWLNGIPELKDSGFIGSVQEGRDKLRYVVITYYPDGASRCALYKTADQGKTRQRIELPYLEKETDYGNGYSAYGFIESFRVLENGNIVIMNGYGERMLTIYSGTDGTEIGKVKIGFKEGVYSDYNAYGNKLIAMSEDGKGVMIYDTEKAKVEKSMEYDYKERSTVTFTMLDDGTLFAADAGGIHRINPGGTLWETVVDGSLNSLGMPNFFFGDLYVAEGTREEYYVMAGTKVLHYVYDETVSAVPGTQITVYSLYENSTIRQAASAYQKSHADVKVNYMVAMGDQGGTVSDYIRALNTELLSGNGADILVLDGLPVDSYIEKGVLSDISSIVEPLIRKGDILANIAEPFTTGDKIYQMPTRFMAPLISGEQKAVDSTGSLARIAAYIQENPELPFVSGLSSEKLIKNMLALSNAELFGDGKALDEQKLEDFLKNIKIVADNTGSEDYKDDPDRSKWSSVKGPGSDLFDTDIFTAAGKKSQASYSLLRNAMDLYIPYAASKEYKLHYGTVNDMFLAYGRVGLNSAGKEADTASDFISFLFGREVQDANVYDGFPVNEASMTQWLIEADNGVSLSTGDSEGKIVISAECPPVEIMKEFVDMLKGLNKPVIVNQTIEDMIMEPVMSYLKGSISADQAASAVLSKVNTYLAE